MSIKNLVEDVRAFLEKRLVCEETAIYPKTSGLQYSIHVMSKGGAKHGPRVKVSNVPGTFFKDDNFSVTVEHEPRIVGNCKVPTKHLSNIVEWVKTNHDHLHNIWHNSTDIDISDMAAGFKHLTN